MKKYLFLFSIGPVQSFIAQARKTQDLYAGSNILSELSKSAIDAIGRDKIIFPFTKMTENDWKHVKSLPNRFVAKFENVDSIDFKAEGERIEIIVRTAWYKMAKDIISKYSPKSFNVFEDQIDQHLDINWLFYPIGDNYADAYENAEGLLSSVKNVRVFKQNPEKGRKCSIDGERNVKFYRMTDEENKNHYLKRKLFLDNEINVEIFEADTEKSPVSVIAKGEGLSAISFVKRGYKKDGSIEKFPSTAKVALMYDESKANKNIKNLLPCYEQLFDKKSLTQTCIDLFNKFIITDLKFSQNDLSKWNTDFDYQYLYEENITDKNFPNRFQRHLIKEVFAKLKSSFSQKYYAILAFDGDKMGKIMSGGFLKDDNKSKLEEFQGRVSELLSDFAQNFAQLEAPQGKTVYAGGDDYLGFVNLNHLFPVMQNLRDNFEREVNQPLKKEFRGQVKDDFEFTFSAGVAVAYYKTPLNIVLKKAQAMQKKAKDDIGRNAFAIAVLKHSGESHEAGLKWYDENANSNIEKMKKIVYELKNNFSDTFIRSLQKESYLLRDNEGNFKHPEIIHIEIERLLKRSLLAGKDKCLILDLAKTVQNLLPINKTRINQFADVDTFIETMLISIFLKRKTSKDE
jgi:CRISPR-associated protein Cmr2